MQEFQTLIYRGFKLRTTQIEGSRWWSLKDVGDIIHHTKLYNFCAKLDSDKKKTIIVGNANNHGGRKMIFINEPALYEVLNHAYRVEAVEFQNWLESEVGVEFPAAQINLVTKKSSIAVILQKAQMLIRIAEHKAVPYDEQIKLLDLAAKELAGVGIIPDKLAKSIKRIDNTSTEPDIMSLPEVTGVIHNKITKNVCGCLIDFLPAELIASKWRIKGNKNDKLDGKEFNSISEEYGFKTPQFGFWERVTMPNGKKAREFMYIDCSMNEYVYKRQYHRKSA